MTVARGMAEQWLGGNPGSSCPSAGSTASVVYKSKNDGNNLTPVSGLLQETLLQPNNKIYKTISKNEDALYVLK